MVWHVTITLIYFSDLIEKKTQSRNRALFMKYKISHYLHEKSQVDKAQVVKSLGSKYPAFPHPDFLRPEI